MVADPLRRRHVAAAFLVFACVAGAAPARADSQCKNVSFGSFSPINYTGAGGGYDVFDATLRTQSVTFTVTNTKKKSCVYVIGASVGTGSGFSGRQLASGTNRLSHNLYVDSTRNFILQDIPQTTQQQVIVGQFNGRGTNTHTYYFSIPIQQIVAPATYSSTVTFSIYDVNDFEVIGAKTVTHAAIVQPQVQISLVPSGGAFVVGQTSQSIDFGTLVPGGRLGVDLLARGNNGYTVSVQSQNKGKLLIQSPTDTSAVPYSATFNGAAVNLASAVPLPVASVAARSTLAGDRLPVQVTIGAIAAGAAAGTYKDAITLTVTSK